MTTTTKSTATKPRTRAPRKQPIEKSISINENLPANPFAFEVFNLVSNQKISDKKVELLRRYEHPSIKSLFIWNYDDSLISLLPEGIVPYSSTWEQTSFSGTVSEKIQDAVYKMNEINSNSLGSQDQGRSSIRKEYTRFYNFIKGGNDALKSLRRETMFINILEGLHPLEAEILLLVKDKKLETKYDISKEIVSEAYPDIVWGNRV
jgi:hypothetical protein